MLFFWVCLLSKGIDELGSIYLSKGEKKRNLCLQTSSTAPHIVEVVVVVSVWYTVWSCPVVRRRCRTRKSITASVRMLEQLLSLFGFTVRLFSSMITFDRRASALLWCGVKINRSPYALFSPYAIAWKHHWGKRFPTTAASENNEQLDFHARQGEWRVQLRVCMPPNHRSN